MPVWVQAEDLKNVDSWEDIDGNIFLSSGFLVGIYSCNFYDC